MREAWTKSVRWASLFGQCNNSIVDIYWNALYICFKKLSNHLIYFFDPRKLLAE